MVVVSFSLLALTALKQGPRVVVRWPLLSVVYQGYEAHDTEWNIDEDSKMYDEASGPWHLEDREMFAKGLWAPYAPADVRVCN